MLGIVTYSKIIQMDFVCESSWTLRICEGFNLFNMRIILVNATVYEYLSYNWFHGTNSTVFKPKQLVFYWRFNNAVLSQLQDHSKYFLNNIWNLALLSGNPYASSSYQNNLLSKDVCSSLVEVYKHKLLISAKSHILIVFLLHILN